VRIAVTNIRENDIPHTRGEEAVPGKAKTFAVEAVVSNAGNAPAVVRSFFLANPDEYARHFTNDAAIAKAYQRWNQEFDFDMVAYVMDERGEELTPGNRKFAFTSLIIPAGESRVASVHALLDRPDDVEKFVLKAEIVDFHGKSRIWNSEVLSKKQLRTNRGDGKEVWLKKVVAGQ
jgi:hypothetical protein